MAPVPGNHGRDPAGLSPASCAIRGAAGRTHPGAGCDAQGTIGRLPLVRDEPEASVTEQAIGAVDDCQKPLSCLVLIHLASRQDGGIA